MALGQPLALSIDNTQPNALGSFQQGVQARQSELRDKIANAEHTATLIGSAAMYALNGDINGEVDPAKYNEVLDSLQQIGVDTTKYRDNPNYAKVFANAAVSYLDRQHLAQSDRDYELNLKKFEEDVRYHSQQLANQQGNYGTVYYAHKKGPNGEDITVPMVVGKHGGFDELPMPDGVDTMVLPGEVATMKAEGAGIGKSNADAEKDYQNLQAYKPQLDQTVAELGALADKATSTIAGQGRDWIAGQFNIGTEGGTAAAAYEARVKDTLFPILKATLGSQFTENDRISLQQTLGDRTMTAQQKHAVLQEFIKSKELEIESLKRRTGRTKATGEGGGTDYKSKYGLE